MAVSRNGTRVLLNDAWPFLEKHKALPTCAIAAEGMANRKILDCRNRWGYIV